MENKIKQVEIGLASPQEIREWALRRIPTGEIVGEVTNWETVNYKTLKPERDGLFCQRIFGPVVDYMCACGKKPTNKNQRFCFICDVEFTTSRVRRYRLGYIQLKQPVVHTLYALHRPSPLTFCLGWSNTRVQAIMYGTEFCKLPAYFSNLVSHRILKRILFQYFESRMKITKIKESEYKTKFTSGRAIDRCFWNKNSGKSRRFSITRIGPGKWSETVRNVKIPIHQTSSDLKVVYFEHSKLRNQNKKPTLFSGGMKKKFLQKKKFEIANFVYGVPYDATWEKVYDIENFLSYISKQVQSNQKPIPYYNFKRVLKTTSPKEIVLHKQYYPIQTGGFVFQKILSFLDVEALLYETKIDYYWTKHYIRYCFAKLKWYGPVINYFDEEQMRIVKKLKMLQNLNKKLLKRLLYLRDFSRTDMKPAWMILSYLPVLPPDLRPIMSIQGQLLVSDLNSLYRKVLIRNKRVFSGTKFQFFDLALQGSWDAWCTNIRQVQEAVDDLLKKGNVESGKKTKSLLDSLKGKKGRFRQHLLGKRVDYSGRSVIVVGPKLKINQCGLPKQMALELFQPFLIQILLKKRPLTARSAKNIIAEQKPIIWSLLADVMKNHPVLLNRAPTLHRLGIQAFLPRLVEGKAILLHPLVCPAFNADFDGDQMAVHVPLGAEARSEALNLMWSRNHLLAPASGQPLLLPTQDMVLGFYYLTILTNLTEKSSKKNPAKRNNLFSIKTSPVTNGLNSPSENAGSSVNPGYYFSTLNEIQQLYDKQILTTHTSVWVRWFGKTQNFVSEYDAKILEQPLEFRINFFGKSEYIFHDRKFEKLKNWSDSFSTENTNLTSFYIRTTPGRIFFHTQFPD